MPEAKYRILVCRRCETVNVIEWCGTRPDCGHERCEDALEYRVAPHRDFTPRGEAPRFHGPVILADVLQSEWNDTDKRRALLKGLECATYAGDGTGLGETLYDLKSNFTDDAAKCWKQHGKTHNCGDFMSASKRLVPQYTTADRKELGLETSSRKRPTSTYLCMFCPIASIMQQRKNSEYYNYGG